MPLTNTDHLETPSNASLPHQVVARNKTSKPTKSNVRVGLIGALVLGVVSAGWLVKQRALPAEVDAHRPSTSSDTDRIVGLGTVLPISGLRTVAAPFGAGDARIATLNVKEGDHVKKGDLVAILDNESVLKAAVEAAKAQVGSRSAAQGQVASSVMASRTELEAQVNRSKVALDNANAEFERAELLLKSGSITFQSLDQHRARRDEARHEFDRIRAARSRYGSGSVYGQADTVLAGSNVNAARADLARAVAELEKAYVRAPLSGTVLTIHADAGERPGGKGILTLGDVAQMKVEVDVYETQIGQVRLGDVAVANAHALPQALSGTVTKIGLEVGKQSTIDLNPAANTDARVVRVTINLDEESSRVSRGLSNLQVTTKFAAKAAQ
jgi:HlyD family secretion protein